MTKLALFTLLTRNSHDLRMVATVVMIALVCKYVAIAHLLFMSMNGGTKKCKEVFERQEDVAVCKDVNLSVLKLKPT